MVDIVHVEVDTWAAILCITGVCSILLIPLWKDIWIFFALWVLGDYVVLAFCYWFLQHNRNIRNMIMDPNAAAAIKDLENGGTISEAAAEFSCETTDVKSGLHEQKTGSSSGSSSNSARKFATKKSKSTQGDGIAIKKKNSTLEDGVLSLNYVGDVGNYTGPNHLPHWARKEDVQTKKRGLLTRFLFGAAPNKFHRLFIFQENGHYSHVYICRLLLVYQVR